MKMTPKKLPRISEAIQDVTRPPLSVEADSTDSGDADSEFDSDELDDVTLVSERNKTTYPSLKTNNDQKFEESGYTKTSITDSYGKEKSAWTSKTTPGSDFSKHRDTPKSLPYSAGKTGLKYNSFQTRPNKMKAENHNDETDKKRCRKANSIVSHMNESRHSRSRNRICRKSKIKQTTSIVDGDDDEEENDDIENYGCIRNKKNNKKKLRRLYENEAVYGQEERGGGDCNIESEDGNSDDTTSNCNGISKGQSLGYISTDDELNWRHRNKREKSPKRTKSSSSMSKSASADSCQVKWKIPSNRLMETRTQKQKPNMFYKKDDDDSSAVFKEDRDLYYEETNGQESNDSETDTDHVVKVKTNKPKKLRSPKEILANMCDDEQMMDDESTVPNDGDYVSYSTNALIPCKVEKRRCINTQKALAHGCYDGENISTLSRSRSHKISAVSNRGYSKHRGALVYSNENMGLIYNTREKSKGSNPALGICQSDKIELKHHFYRAVPKKSKKGKKGKKGKKEDDNIETLIESLEDNLIDEGGKKEKKIKKSKKDKSETKGDSSGNDDKKKGKKDKPKHDKKLKKEDSADKIDEVGKKKEKKKKPKKIIKTIRIGDYDEFGDYQSIGKKEHSGDKIDEVGKKKEKKKKTKHDKKGDTSGEMSPITKEIYDEFSDYQRLGNERSSFYETEGLGNEKRISFETEAYNAEFEKGSYQSNKSNKNNEKRYSFDDHIQTELNNTERFDKNGSRQGQNGNKRPKRSMIRATINCCIAFFIVYIAMRCIQFLNFLIGVIIQTEHAEDNNDKFCLWK